MRVAIRADASLDMGTGHVMRCLTLADALRAEGADCRFICREHPGHLMDHIRARSYRVHALPVESSVLVCSEVPAHAHWLGATQEQDAVGTAAWLAEEGIDWLIVDHYALDARWEALLRPHSARLMVIDDLADRPHLCDVLLDQTYGKDADRYRARVPGACKLLCGSRYALLRPEFALARASSLAYRSSSSLRHLLITMGGVDKDNVTSAVLCALAETDLPADCDITVVMGPSAPWLNEVRRIAAGLPWSTEIKVGVGDMAQLMADVYLAIGAAGATSWERCCLGLPTVMIVLADNQSSVAQGLKDAGAALVIAGHRQVAAELPGLMAALLAAPDELLAMSNAASHIVDGLGVARVLGQMGVGHGNG